MITIPNSAKIDVHTTLTYGDMQNLFPICRYGLPEKMDEDMRDSLQALVCL